MGCLSGHRQSGVAGAGIALWQLVARCAVCLHTAITLSISAASGNPADAIPFIVRIAQPLDGDFARWRLGYN